MNTHLKNYTDSAVWYGDCQSPERQKQAAAYEALFAYLSRAALLIVREQPEPESLAQDCAQEALIRIHEQLDACRNPNAFRTWSRQIVSNLAIDTLRRRSKLTFAVEDEMLSLVGETAEHRPSPESEIETADYASALYTTITQAPISDQSRRVVTGRYLKELPDEPLAARESELAGKTVLPSHIQVTRSKNMTKLRKYQPLLDLLEMEK